MSSKPKGTYDFCACGDHAFATVTKGFVVMVSPEDAHQLQYRWAAQCREETGWYVLIIRHKTVSPGRRKTVSLAREIMGNPAGLMVDHADRNTLDNRRPNLRCCTKSQNQANRRGRRHSILGVKGVRVTNEGRFEARIRARGEDHQLGTYDTIPEASAAYLEAAVRLHGEFARAR